MPNETILIVSPKDDQSRLICDCLAKAGYEVLLDDLGQSALKTLFDRRPDLALVDWKLSDLSGLALIRIIRSGEFASKMPIILTASGMQEEDFIWLSRSAQMSASRSRSTPKSSLPACVPS